MTFFTSIIQKKLRRNTCCCNYLTQKHHGFGPPGVVGVGSGDVRVKNGLRRS